MNQLLLKRPQVSPLRYPGGKGVLYPLLRSLIRRNGLTGCTYAEPYAGGAGAGLALLLTGEVSRLVINDLDPSIYAFWTALISDPGDFARKIRSVPLTVAEWRSQKEVYAHPHESAIDLLGFATFYLNRTNRSGVLNGGPIGGLDQSGNYKMDARFNREALAERVRAIGLYASRIEVRNEDGRDVVLAMAQANDALTYADPPYFEKAGSLYLNYFSPADHSALAAALNRYRLANWILTYDNAPEVKSLYGERHRRKISLNYSAHRVQKATEIMVLSDSMRDVE